MQQEILQRYSDKLHNSKDSEAQLGEVLSLVKLKALLKALIRHHSVLPSGQGPGRMVSPLLSSIFRMCCLLGTAISFVLEMWPL